jgi:hypothetical protein
MADQQFPPKLSRSKSRPLSSSPSKIRRLEAPITPPDSSKDVESDSSPPSLKQQPENAPNPTITTALSSSDPPAATAHISKPPVAVRPVDYTGMSLKERSKLLDCVVERDAELLQRRKERDQQRENEWNKMSKAEREQWRIEFCKKHRKIIRHYSRSEANITHRNN